MSTNMNTHALTLASHGLAIFPCRPSDKRPLIADWGNQASSDPSQIKEWWSQWPDANIGLPTGSRNRLLVLDVDVKNAANGLDSLAKLQSEYGDLPKTATVNTPSGGIHYYFAYPEDADVRNKAGFLPGLDIRAEGGYVVAPASLIGEHSYEWKVPLDEGVSICPIWLLEKIVEQTDHGSDAVESARQGAPEGSRNDSIFRYAASLISRGLPYADAVELVLSRAAQCDPPLEEDEARQCLDSAYGRYAPSRPLTDLGNAERFVDRFGSLTRYVPNLSSWYVWNGLRWARSDLGEINQFAKATVRGIRDEALRESDDSKRDALLKHAKKSESANSSKNIIELARMEDDMSIPGEILDDDDVLFGVQNGTLNLKTGEISAPDALQYITLTSAAIFDQAVLCPRWQTFLQEVTGDDLEMVEFLQRCIGYSLLGGNPAQKLFVLHGLGANGKSTFLRTIQHLFGTYAKAVEGSLFMVQRNQSGGGAREDLLRLRGARFIVSVELGDGYVLNEELVKRMTGDDTMTARGVYAKHSIEFTPSFTPWIATNHKPIVKGDDHAIWRRIALIPFDQTIEKKDPFLVAKLRKELPGILNWALEGCLKWRKDLDLRIPRRVAAATADYQSEMDLLEEWFELYCETDAEGREKTANLYTSYKGYAIKHGEPFPISKNSLSRKLSSRGFEKTKIGGHRGFRGIALKVSAEGEVAMSLGALDRRVPH